MKRAFIIHGWDSSPDDCWFPWLKKELLKKGFKVAVPAMPHPSAPSIDDWVKAVRDAVGKLDDETYLIGHSVGCQAILRFLESLPEGQGKHGGCKAAALICVTPWFTLAPQATPDDEYRKTAKPWLTIPIDFSKAASHVKRIVAIFSDDDPYVPIDNSEVYERKLGAKVLFEHAKGHMGGEDDVKEIPAVLDEMD